MDTSPPGVPSGNPNSLHDLGVLFVHGIGEQKRGDTLLQFGEPVADWINRWLDGDRLKQQLGYAEFRQGALQPPLLEGDEPAHAELRISVNDGTTSRHQHWLFAEAWWGSQVATPSLTSFLGWLVTRGPWVILLHFHQRAFVRSGSRWPVPLRGAGVLVAWFVLSTLLAFAWTVVSLLALIPIGRIRAAVYAALRRIAGVVGDSYVFLRAPIQGAALINATLAGLDWLAARCKRIVVVAHSQGVAVAHGALGHPDAPPVVRFVTFGAGLGKLQALRVAEMSYPGQVVSAGCAAPLLAIAALWFVRVGHLTDVDSVSYFGPAVFALTGVVLLAVAWRSVRGTLAVLQEKGALLTLREQQPGVVWHDVFATHDPVPNGALARSIRLPEVRSRRVTVLRSLLKDHTSYWRSLADFVPFVVRELDRAARLRLFADGAAVLRLRIARRLDAFRVRVLGWLGLANLLALAVPVVFVFPRLVQDGDAIRHALAGSPLAVVAVALGGIDAALKWIATDLLAVPIGEGVSLSSGVAIVVLWAAVLMVWQRIYAVAWTWWRSLALEGPFTPSDRLFSDTEWDAWLLAAVMIALGLTPLLLSLAWTFWPETVREQLFYWLIGAAFGSFIVILLLIGMAQSFAESWRGLSESTHSLAEFAVHAERFATSLLVTGVIAWLVSLMFFPPLASWLREQAAVIVLPILFAVSYAQLCRDIAQSSRPRWRKLLAAVLPWLVVFAFAAVLYRTGVYASGERFAPIAFGMLFGYAACHLCRPLVRGSGEPESQY